MQKMKPGLTAATWIALIALSTWPSFGEEMQHGGYAGARAHLTLSRFTPRFSGVLEGGIHRRSTERNLFGLGIGGTVNSYDDHGLREWFVPIHFELQFIHFPKGRIGIGRYYQAGARTTRSFLIWRENWTWRRYEYGYVTYHLSAGHSWSLGSGKNIRIEGRILSSGEQLIPWLHAFQVAVCVGRWF